MTEPLHRFGPGPLVASGGFAGAIVRYGVDVLVGASLESTLLVNAIGSVALALVLAGWLDHGGSDRLRRFAATGFLSSFTTYSAFVVGTIQSDPPVAIGYVVATYAVGFTCAGLGLAIAERGGGRW
ncbi:camphor resistance protein crcb [Salinarchaeum sp. Harcht-Bsk1]|uniref:fluoride efflux transporter FluC n=1 Tax=Salinarchaeum sp. Harcht-Bsk1 TaxID=1333523 RepID=UPI0003424168|nr:CrcB family protein [Salinarchaeum sp. Harcht-Bsk1]AGN02913.1 camphor resistance protein crcb [Salinarchaeum sp. Harcht-Bsk1]